MLYNRDIYFIISHNSYINFNNMLDWVIQITIYGNLYALSKEIVTSFAVTVNNTSHSSLFRSLTIYLNK